MTNLDEKQYRGFLSDCKVLGNMYYDVEFTELNSAFEKMAKIFKNVKERNMLGRHVVPKSVFEYLQLQESYEKYPYEFYRFKYDKYQCYIERHKKSYAVFTDNYDFPQILFQAYKKKGCLFDRFNCCVFPANVFKNPLEAAKELFLSTVERMLCDVAGRLL